MLEIGNKGGQIFIDSDAAPDLAALNLKALSTAPQDSAQIQQLSPAALAYLGDAVYELYVRTCYLLPPKRSQVYHAEVVAQVRAESQARTLQLLKPYLTVAELEIVRRGRNATGGKPRRLDPEIYQQATSLETLMGYLYITDSQRLTELLKQIRSLEFKIS